MNVVIRTDASLEIGTGHVMRCLALAEGLHHDGHSVCFVCRDGEGHLGGLITRNGWPCVLLPQRRTQRSVPSRDQYAAWLPGGQDQDAFDTVAAIRSRNATTDWVVVDHYAIDAEWEQALRPDVGHVLVIDDLRHRAHDADICIQQQCLVTGSAESVFHEDGTVMLRGPAYALLRSEFRAARAVDRRSESRPRLLVFFGGVDSSNETGKTLDSIRVLGTQKVAVDVITGGRNQAAEILESQCAGMQNVTCRREVTNMAELMVGATLGIGAAGVTTWERCCVGLPSVVAAIADNQIALAALVDRAGAAVNLGSAAQVTPSQMAWTIKMLLADSERLQRMRSKCLDLVDGLGVQRVVRAMTSVTAGRTVRYDQDPAEPALSVVASPRGRLVE